MTKLIPITFLTLTLQYFFGKVNLKGDIKPLKYDTDGADIVTFHLTNKEITSRIHSYFFALFLIYRHLFTHPITHTQTMAHCHHHPPLSRRCVSGHVLFAVTLPIGINAAVACLPPSFLSPVPALLRLVAIALFVAVAIAIAIAAIIIALFDAHQCALSPLTVIPIHIDGGVGDSLAPAAAAWRQQRQ